MMASTGRSTHPAGLKVAGLKVIVATACAVCVAPLERTVVADVVYNTFGPNGEYTNIFWTIGTGQPQADYERAMEFTVNGPDVVLTAADIAAMRLMPGGPVLRAAVYLDAGQGPGALLETSEEFNLTAFWDENGAVIGEAVTSAPFSGSTLLHLGQTYWLGVSEVDDAYLGWFRAHVAPLENSNRRVVGTAQWTQSTINRLAMRIHGNPMPQCDGDANGSGEVDSDDLVTVILAWGQCTPPPALCPADFSGNGAVDADDLNAVILSWGACK